MASLSIAAASPAAAHNRAATEPATVKPKAVNELDCNGWGKKYKTVDPGFRRLCVDPRGPKLGKKWSTAVRGYSGRGRFMDNGHYVGHDEPSVKFISSAANSGNTMTYIMKMPVDPTKPATDTGTVIDYAELSPAPWFGLPLCDPESYPQNPCTPDSDSNLGGIKDKNAAGSAFMELQFYPPGFTPFYDDVSCNKTKWCAALTIDSLESYFNFAGLNTACEEPSNFAFLQRNGVPAGPPGPQLADVATYTPNSHTLLINGGDVLEVAISDPAAGFTTTVTDLSTGQTGYMVASAANGFMDTNVKTCDGTPHTFHAEYATAAPQNQVPWAALEGGVLMEQETGHSEVCSSLANKDPVTGPGFKDRDTYDTCVGGTEGGTLDKGEGPCNAKTGVCVGSTTEGTTGPIACPSDNFDSGQLCEFADGICIPQGGRAVTIEGHSVTATSPVNFCQANRFQNGDLDFDGIPYQKKSWPDGSSDRPTSIRYAGPFDQAGNPYPSIQFETDIAGSEFLCNVTSGLNCDAPPLSASFYPFWTLTDKAGQGIGPLFSAPDCIWNFGNAIPGVTTRKFGKDAQYGVPDTARYGGTIISKVHANPEVTATAQL